MIRQQTNRIIVKIFLTKKKENSHVRLTSFNAQSTYPSTFRKRYADLNPRAGSVNLLTDLHGSLHRI